MPDAFGVPLLDRFPNMKVKVVGRDKSNGKLASVKADVHLGVNFVQIVEHLHVQVEVVAWNVPVLGHHEIESDEARIGLRELKAEHDFCEHHLAREAAQDLIQVVNRDLTTGIGMPGGASENFLFAGFVAVELCAG